MPLSSIYSSKEGTIVFNNKITAQCEVFGSSTIDEMGIFSDFCNIC